jgi:hypothetical protein
LLYEFRRHWTTLAISAISATPQHHYHHIRPTRFRRSEPLFPATDVHLGAVTHRDGRMDGLAHPRYNAFTRVTKTLPGTSFRPLDVRSEFRLDPMTCHRDAVGAHRSPHLRSRWHRGLASTSAAPKIGELTTSARARIQAHAATDASTCVAPCGITVPFPAPLSPSPACRTHDSPYCLVMTPPTGRAATVSPLSPVSTGSNAPCRDRRPDPPSGLPEVSIYLLQALPEAARGVRVSVAYRGAARV